MLRHGEHTGPHTPGRDVLVVVDGSAGAGLHRRLEQRNRQGLGTATPPPLFGPAFPGHHLARAQPGGVRGASPAPSPPRTTIRTRPPPRASTQHLRAARPSAGYDRRAGTDRRHHGCRPRPDPDARSPVSTRIRLETCSGRRGSRLSRCRVGGAGRRMGGPRHSCGPGRRGGRRTACRSRLHPRRLRDAVPPVPDRRDAGRRTPRRPRRLRPRHRHRRDRGRLRLRVPVRRRAPACPGTARRGQSRSSRHHREDSRRGCPTRLDGAARTSGRAGSAPPVGRRRLPVDTPLHGDGVVARGRRVGPPGARGPSSLSGSCCDSAGFVV